MRENDAAFNWHRAVRILLAAVAAAGFFLPVLTAGGRGVSLLTFLRERSVDLADAAGNIEGFSRGDGVFAGFALSALLFAGLYILSFLTVATAFLRAAFSKSRKAECAAAVTALIFLALALSSGLRAVRSLWQGISGIAEALAELFEAAAGVVRPGAGFYLSAAACVALACMRWVRGNKTQDNSGGRIRTL